MDLSVATVLFAVIVASLIAAPTPAVRPDQSAASASPAKAALPVAKLSEGCSQQNWPNFDASCLRQANANQVIREIPMNAVDQR